MRFFITGVVFLSIQLFNSFSSAASNPTDYFRSKTSGNWTSVSSWESSTGAAGPWANATLVPTQAANTITILNNHTIRISTARTFDQLVIKSGGKLELLTGGSITLNNGTGIDLTIESGGKLNILSSQNYSSTIFPGTSTMSITGDVEIGNTTTNAGTGYEVLASNTNNAWLNGSKYVHNSASTVVTGANITFFANATGNTVLEIRRISGTLGNAVSLTVNGYVNIYTNVTVDGAGTKLFRDGFYGNNTLTFAATSGTINVGSASPNNSISGNLRFILHKNVNILYNTTMFSVSAFGDVMVIDNTSTAKFVISTSRSLTLDVATTLNLGTQAVITNNGSFINNGTLRTANANGLTGSALASISGGTVTNDVDSYVEYYGGNQSVTAITYGNLTISGTGTKTAGTFNLSTSGTLYITGSATLNATGNIGPTTANSTDLIMDGSSRYILRTAGTQPNMQGTYTLSGSSTIEFANNNASAQSIRNGSTYIYHNIDISGNNVGNASANIFLNGSSVFRVTSTGIFSNNSNSIQAQSATSGQSVNLIAGSVFKVFNQAGFNGTTTTAIHQTITSFSLAEGSTVDYTRNGDQTITNANSVQYGNLVLSVSGIKTAPSSTLTIKGNLDKTGNVSFAHNNGTVVMNGTSTQEYTSSFPFMKFYNLNNNNTTGLYLNSEMSIEKQLGIGASSKLTLQNGSNIILLSSLTGTANVSAVPAGATVTYVGTGKFTVQRYIETGPTPNHGKSWQFLSIPTNGSQTINQAWQDTATSSNQSRYSGFGTQITSDITPLPSMFDVYTANGPSMKTYVAASNSWTGVPNTTTTPIHNPKGYMVFVRGDRTVTTFNAPANETILRTSGQIFWPVSNPPSTTIVASDKFESIGNPYASAIDFSNESGVIKSAAVQKVFYLWDPKLGGSFGYGGFQTFTRGIGADNNYYITPGGGSYGSIGSVNNFIQSGQAFLVRTSGASGTVSFSESAKVNSSSTPFRPSAAASVSSKLYTRLEKINTGDTLILDGITVEFGREFNNQLDPTDVYKFTNAGESISILKANTELTVERRNYPENLDTINLKMTNLKPGQYRLQFLHSQFEDLETKPYLFDRFLQQLIPLDISAGISYHFSISSNPASNISDRFLIVFKRRFVLTPPAEYSFAEPSMPIEYSDKIKACR